MTGRAALQSGRRLVGKENRGGMGSLEKKISEWVEKGLLGPEQAEAIYAHEAQRQGPNWVGFGIAGIGVVALLTGVVSIIAANWDTISPSTKLLVYFFMQAGLIAGFITSCRRDGVVREIILLAMQLFTLAGIGLIAQIFNLSGEGWEALTLWLVLVLPLTLHAQKKLAHNIWFIGLAAAVIIWMTQHDDAGNRVASALGICFMVFALGLLRRFQVPKQFSEAALFWSLLFLLCVATTAADVAWGHTARHHGATFAVGSLPLAIYFGAAILVLFALLDRNELLLEVKASVASMLLVMAGFFVPLYSGIGIDNKIFGCTGFLAIWSLAAAAAAFAKRRGYFNFASSIIALRFIVVYFQVFGSLSATGIGLIISGAEILGISYAWHRIRRRVGTLIWSKP